VVGREHGITEGCSWCIIGGRRVHFVRWAQPKRCKQKEYVTPAGRKEFLAEEIKRRRFVGKTSCKANSGPGDPGPSV
jgi:hypothetical protein